MAGGARHLYARDTDEIVLGGEVSSAEAALYQVVIGDSEGVKADSRGPREQSLDGVAPVVGVLGVGVKFDRQHSCL